MKLTSLQAWWTIGNGTEWDGRRLAIDRACHTRLRAARERRAVADGGAVPGTTPRPSHDPGYRKFACGRAVVPALPRAARRRRLSERTRPWHTPFGCTDVRRTKGSRRSGRRR